MSHKGVRLFQISLYAISSRDIEMFRMTKQISTIALVVIGIGGNPDTGSPYIPTFHHGLTSNDWHTVIV